MSERNSPAINEEWYTMPSEDGQWSIRFKNAPNGNFLGKVPRWDITEYIVQLQQAKMDKQNATT